MKISLIMVGILCVAIAIDFAWLTKKNLDSKKIETSDFLFRLPHDNNTLQFQALTSDKLSTDTAEQTFWVKVGFSALLTLAALWVVLSNKYGESTQKWAISVLTLIAGVWIGSATK